jgi:hypothetical protein
VSETLAVVTIPSKTGLPEDATQNSFMLSHDDILSIPANLLLITGCLRDFYVVSNAAGDNIAEHLSNSVDRGTLKCRVRYYDMDGHLDGSNHGSPIAEDGFTMTPPALSTTSLPGEVSTVLTLRALGWQGEPVETPDNADPDAVVQRPRQRKSGRLFIGPLNAAASLTDGPTGVARPSQGWRTCLLDAAERLTDNLAALASPIAWTVWSRADGIAWTITDVQVDDAFDTQRRRGVAASNRQTRTVVP